MEELLKQLTGKNSQYVFDVLRLLKHAGVEEDTARTLVTEKLPEIIENQKKRVTARELLGTPTEFVASLGYGEGVEASTALVEEDGEDDTPWKMIADTFLLLFGALSLLNGIMGMINPNNILYGLVSLIGLAGVGAVVVYLMYYFIHRKNQRGEQVQWGKTVLIMMASFAVWFLIIAATAMLPKAFNPQMPTWLMVVLGGAALIVRHFFVKANKIKSSFAANSRSSRN
jgi:uncharacterized membrane-anchored protein